MRRSRGLSVLATATALIGSAGCGALDREPPQDLAQSDSPTPVEEGVYDFSTDPDEVPFTPQAEIILEVPPGLAEDATYQERRIFERIIARTYEIDSTKNCAVEFTYEWVDEADQEWLGSDTWENELPPHGDGVLYAMLPTMTPEVLPGPPTGTDPAWGVYVTDDYTSSVTVVPCMSESMPMANSASTAFPTVFRVGAAEELTSQDAASVAFKVGDDGLLRPESPSVSDHTYENGELVPR